LIKETLPYYLPKFDAIVKENGGYFVGGKVRLLLGCKVSYKCSGQ